ncbi:MAG TPA: Na+/H+ antiporter NhaA [Burkholderiales bacterium]|nr:Na+/H+ antiporter NhaA [Burkholderiales bacterium]
MEREHALGADTADITLVEYGSYHCPYCKGAHDVVSNLRDRFGERLRYVFRHRPITGDERAQRAAELAEYAGQSAGRFWEAHDALMQRGAQLAEQDLDEVGERLGLQRDDEEAWSRARQRVREDRESARRHGANSSPTFLINGRRYEGPWDENTLAEALRGSLGHRFQSAALDFARWAPSTGLLLLVMTLLAVALDNSPFGAAFDDWWRMPVGLGAGDAVFRLPLRDWINDGLLTVFFLVVGLEIKREFTVGRLASKRAAALPFAAAIGGMALPAAIYLAVAPAGAGAGWAIPTTTDTAFAVALIALLGRRVPVELRIFLTAAVIVDDLAAIAIVALFYSTELHALPAAGAAALTALLVFLNRAGVYRPLPYVLLGIALWACLHAAGLHATLAGVVLAVFTPTRPPANLAALMAQAESVLHEELNRAGERVMRHGPSEPTLRALDAIHDRIESPADKLLRAVEPWSSYLVLPVFALANAGIALSTDIIAGHERLILAIVLGLVIGKPAGMVLTAFLAVKLGIAVKPAAYSWRQLAGAGALAGIGFTMSLYIAAKAFSDPQDFAAAKLAVFIASLLAGAIGTALLVSAAQVDERDAGGDEQRGEREVGAERL